MQCFICVTYMIILCSAHPPKDKALINPHQKRSLFRDVIESFRIRAQLPENLNQNLENNIGQNYDTDNSENELAQLPSDADFIPRRNDRIEMPLLKYRFPKSLMDTEEKKSNDTKEEVVLYINTGEKNTKTTQKPKKQKRPFLGNKNKNPSKENEEEDNVNTQISDSYIPMANTMTGESQIGNRESQTVVKPTVIVNFRGSLSHRDSDIRLESRSENYTLDNAKNVFNINQEVNFEKKKDNKPNSGKPKGPDVKHQLSIIETVPAKPKVEEDMLMCETATWHPQKNTREGRKIDSVLQILFSL